MLKVLHLIHHFNRGGIEKWLLSMLQQISRSDCEMDFCCKGAGVGPLAAIARQHQAQVFHCPLGVNHIKFARQLSDLLDKGQYQILHNHLGVYSGFPVWIAHQQGIPVLTSFHNTHYAAQTQFTQLPLIRQLRSVYGKVSINYALHHSDRVTGCSEAVINSLDPSGNRLRGRATVLNYGVTLPPLATPAERNTFRQSLGWDSDTPLILHVGRLVEQKNHSGLLAIFQRVLQQIPIAKLLLVGEGSQRASIEAAIANLGLSRAVRLLGARDDVPSLMSNCDVFLFPSIHEGFGLVAIEANAARLPIVGSRIPGLMEAVQDGKTGILHAVEDVDGMANSVIRLIRDRQYAQQFIEAGQAWVTQHFSSEVRARELLELYQALAKPVSSFRTPLSNLAQTHL
jgi:glycosyltransferase EpsF